MNSSQTNDENVKDQVEDQADFNIAGDEGEGAEVMDIDQARKQNGDENDDNGAVEIVSKDE